MKMYLPFGDWSDDGHGKYKNVLIEAPSMEHLLQAQIALKEKYGQFFFNGMAENYDEPYLSEEVWQALIDTNYPVERFAITQDTCEWDEMTNLQEVLAVDSNPYVSLDCVIDAFIWLLNAYGAEITLSDEDIPMICNWTCHGFETVGYGCFYA